MFFRNHQKAMSMSEEERKDAVKYLRKQETDEANVVADLLLKDSRG